MRIIAIAALALFMTACESAEEQEQRVQQSLPNGCELLDLGSYNGVRKLVIVRCDGRTTTTNGYRHVNQGKSTRYEQFTAVVID